ncbi:UBE4A [Lepeophtheirus salmonis]|uniref:RING-type E3 ubiquitin transferase n=1 Tax=Lepeophtheirus salmonis TaxID=72036 RepID=A0A7R8CQ12_LEPSM|nr:UBE4A [Lepeophtheirus salmonis]CAF2858398.1 UBE4A [Lepeophtheirus salmonis]
MLKIDLTYTANECSVSEDSFLRGIHLSNLNRDTALVPREKEQELLTPMEEGKPYNFITDIYFLTHKAVDLGFGVVQEKILKLNKELVQLQELHRNSEASPEAKEDIQRRMDTEQQSERPSWESLPSNERARKRTEYMNMGRLARFHNIMGKETITVLDRLTTEMLNHFLKNLVGPERKSFKVKNLDDYDFEPGEIVTNIAKIYVNYIDSEAVLNRMEKVQLCEEFKCCGDPVTLPDSGQIVDRSTIARHLLSDQSDPFNRMPLSMDRILPNEALKEEIHEWMKKQKEAANQSS